MAKHALIFDGAVIDTAATPFPVAVGMSWVDITGRDPMPEPGWRYANGQFSAPPDPVPSRSELIAGIEQRRDYALTAGVEFDGQTFPSDERFQSQLQAFLLAWTTGLLAADATVSIRRQDNVTVSMGRQQVTALAATLLAHVQSIWAASWAAKDALQ